MYHSTIQTLLDDLMENPDEIIVTAKSKRGVLYGNNGGSAIFLQGNFEGTPEEQEAKVRRIIKKDTDLEKG